LAENFTSRSDFGDSRRVRAVVIAALALQLGCVEVDEPPSSPLAAVELESGLPPSARVARAMRFASAQVGKSYCWGGVGPRCFDCSGLVQQSWRAAGLHLPRTADDIVAVVPEVQTGEPAIGDVLWWPGHVGLYAGDGWVIDAYDSRHGVVRRRPHRLWRRVFRPSDLVPEPAALSQSGQ
jgi:cell wall-associated NlpC family hydrolase